MLSQLAERPTVFLHQRRDGAENGTHGDRLNRDIVLRVVLRWVPLEVILVVDYAYFEERGRSVDRLRNASG